MCNNVHVLYRGAGEPVAHYGYAHTYTHSRRHPERIRRGAAVDGAGLHQAEQISTPMLIRGP